MDGVATSSLASTWAITGTATSLGISLQVDPVQAGGGLNPQLRLDGFHDGSVRLHFVYGVGSFEDEPDTHILRSLAVTSISTGPESVSDWESYVFDDPVPTENHRLVSDDHFGFQGGGRSGIMSESQLVLDDSNSPSTGELVSGWWTRSNSLLVENDHNGGVLNGRVIVGWRWRADNAGSDPLTLRARPIGDGGARFFFVYDDREPPTIQFRRGRSNDDDAVDLSDAAFTLNWLFLGGRTPPSPGPFRCGLDETSDGLGCGRYDACPVDLPGRPTR